MSKRTSGLFKRGDIYHIDKIVNGHRIRCSTGTGDLREAEIILARRVTELRDRTVHGQRKQLTFQQAAEKYLQEDCPAKTMERTIVCLDHVMPYIGHLRLEQVHNGALATFKADRLKAGAAPGTINKELATVSRVLNLAARQWRDELTGMAYLGTAPLIKWVEDKSPREPYPLTWDEQDRLLAVLPDHLRRMALFAVNTGLRQEELCGLRWEWEVRVPELDTSVFILPAEKTKTGQRRVVVLNDIARECLSEVRGEHPEYVFTYQGRRVLKMNTPAWQRLRKSVGLPQVRVHDLRHTFGQRLRAAGVDFEDRQDLLGHKNGNVTTHYSAPDIRRLLNAVQALTVRPGTSTILRVVPTSSPQGTVEKAEDSREATYLGASAD